MADHSRHPPHEATRLPHVGTYRCVLPVSIERLYENAVDWAHLPHLHSGSFSAIRCLAAGAWGFRAAVETPAGGTSVIELSLDRRLRRWITRTLEGRNVGAEIWTHAFAIEPRRTDIVVDFFVPDVAATARARVGTAFADLYIRLYDEDEAMMVERQRQLDRRIDSAHAPSEVVLGRVGALEFPRVEPYRGHDFWIVRGWNGSRPLVDPMCGSGTLLAEALVHYCGIPAPFLRRRFGFEQLPDFDRRLWTAVKIPADRRIRPLPAGLVGGSDVTAEAVESARANLQKLPHGATVPIERMDYRQRRDLPERVIVCNPPYGRRLQPKARLEEFYRTLGVFLKQRCRGAVAYIYFGNREMLKHIGLKPS